MNPKVCLGRAQGSISLQQEPALGCAAEHAAWCLGDRAYSCCPHQDRELIAQLLRFLGASSSSSKLLPRSSHTLPAERPCKACRH